MVNSAKVSWEITDKISMKWTMLSLFLVLSLSSCGQEIANRRLSSEGSTTNDYQVLDCQETSGQVCGQPPMPVCPAGLVCAQVMPNPETYANECEMKKVSAQFIQNGPCPSTTL